MSAIMGGCGDMKENDERNSPTKEEQELMTVNKKDIELLLRHDFNDIDKVTLTDVEKTPMGYFINGYANGDKELSFSASITNEKFDGSLGLSEKFDSLLKSDAGTSLSEIKKERDVK